MEAVKKDLQSRATKAEVEAKLSLDEVQNLLKELEHKTESSLTDAKEETNAKVDSLEVSLGKFGSELTALQQELANKAAKDLLDSKPSVDDVNALLKDQEANFTLKLQEVTRTQNSLGDDLKERLKELEQQVAEDEQEQRKIEYAVRDNFFFVNSLASLVDELRQATDNNYFKLCDLKDHLKRKLRGVAN